jgi:hypothetical protein
MKIQAQVIADSTNQFGNRITTMIVTFPRFILAEFNTHRMFSRNSASSRAIPFEKMVKSIQENPFIPIAFQKNHKGMQGTEYITHPLDIQTLKNIHLTARDLAIEQAEKLTRAGVTKQIANRYLEPFMWHTVVVTFTEIENFFTLRCPQYEVFEGNDVRLFRSKKDLLDSLLSFPAIKEAVSKRIGLDWLRANKGQAEIHMMALAEAMWDAYNESTPERLGSTEWHIPYENEIEKLFFASNLWDKVDVLPNVPIIAMISSVMCARVSYTVAGTDLSEWTIEKYINKALELANADPLHASPFEHCAEAMSENDLDNFVKMEDGVTEIGWCRNFKGFKQLRYTLENRNK